VPLSPAFDLITPTSVGSTVSDVDQDVRVRDCQPFSEISIVPPQGKVMGEGAHSS
jgi:hypothetical protein